jgi:hypothetical protein
MSIAYSGFSFDEHNGNCNAANHRINEELNETLLWECGSRHSRIAAETIMDKVSNKTFDLYDWYPVNNTIQPS